MASFFSYFLIPFTLFLIFLYKWCSNTASTAGKRLPPSPGKLPIIGNLHQVGFLPHKTFHSFAKKYGPLMLLHYGSVPVLVASSADAAREILKTQDLIFSSKPKSRIHDIVFYGGRTMAFSQYGEHWRQMRAICVLKLLSTTRVQSFRHVREEVTSMMIEKIKKLGSSHSVLNLTDIVASLAMDISCGAVLGIRTYSGGEGGTKVKKILDDGSKILGTPSFGNYIPWLAWIDNVSGLYAKAKRRAKEMDEFLESIVEEHRSRRINGEMMNKSDDTALDFVDMLLQVQRESKDTTTPLENETIKAMLLDMLSGGIDTTYAALEWTIAILLKNPRTMKKLQKEVRDVAADREEITEDDLDKMPYLKAVFKESLRYHSLAPLILHESNQDTKVMGYDIPVGTRVYVNVWAISRDPTVWENPEDFIPERFLNSSTDFRGHHYEFIPFGAGRRGCPGASFAVATNEIALAKLVHKFDFKLADGGREEDLDMSEVGGLTIHKKHPILVVATPYTYSA